MTPRAMCRGPRRRAALVGTLFCAAAWAQDAAGPAMVVTNAPPAAAGSLPVQGDAPGEPAPEGEGGAVPLPEVVVTATRLPDAGPSPSVTVLRREDLKARGITTLQEALRTVPGLQMVSSGTPGQLGSLFTRGTESNHTPVMIDGVRTAAGLAGMYDIANISLDNVERVEVVRGPHSTLYGSDAIGGVVNIITRSGAGQKPAADASVEAGSYNTLETRASVVGSSGPVHISGSVSRFTADYERLNDTVEQYNARFKLGVDPTPDLKFSLLFSGYRSNVETPGSVPISTPTATLERYVATVAPKIEWRAAAPWRHTLVGSYSRERQLYEIPPVVENETLIDSLGLDYQTDVEVTRRWTLSAGFALDHDHVDLTQLKVFQGIDQSLASIGLFAQSRLEVAQGLTLVNQARYVDYSEFDAPFTWKNAAVYRAPWGSKVHASIGTAYAPPSLQDHYFPGFGNTNLSPEESFSWEAGAAQEAFGGRARLSSTYFETEVDNLIQFNAALLLPQNVAKAAIHGVETALDLDPCEAFTLRAGHTWLFAEELRPDGTAARLLRRPRHSFFATGTVRPGGGVALSVEGNWQCGREDIDAGTLVRSDLPDYFVLRTRIEWQVREGLAIWARVENLTDEEYQEVSGYPAPSRGYYAGARCSF